MGSVARKNVSDCRVSIEGVYSLILGVFYAFVLGFYKRNRFISREYGIEPMSPFLLHIDEFLLALLCFVLLYRIWFILVLFRMAGAGNYENYKNSDSRSVVGMYC